MTMSEQEIRTLRDLMEFEANRKAPPNGFPVLPDIPAGRYTDSRFFVRRLRSGNLLLVKHGPVTERTGRSHLMAFISGDDGETWGGGLLLDERDGVSYPDGQQDEAGAIHIIYDYDRTGAREILTASFREDDVAAARLVTPAGKVRSVVCAAGPDR